MDHWQPYPDAPTRFALFRPPASVDPVTGADSHHTAARPTEAGAAWLASATPAPHRTLARWAECPGTPAALPCGTAFDVVSAPAVFGRRMADRLWSDGPGTGPVAVHRGRMLLFTAPGTARLLPALLDRQARPAQDREAQEREPHARQAQVREAHAREAQVREAHAREPLARENQKPEIRIPEPLEPELPEPELPEPELPEPELPEPEPLERDAALKREAREAEREERRARGPAVPPLLFHGAGDTVTVPPPVPPRAAPAGGPGAPAAYTAPRGSAGLCGSPAPCDSGGPCGHGDAYGKGDGYGNAYAHGGPYGTRDRDPYGSGAAYGIEAPAAGPRAAPPDRPAASRWLVAPDVRHPWLPGGEALLWACLRAVRGPGEGGEGRRGRAHLPVLAPCRALSIFAQRDPDANVFPVGRR